MQKAPSTSDHNALSVLLIDDDELILDSLSELLAAEGFQIHTAKGSAESIALISNGVCPDVVLVDYRMQHQNGFEVVKRIRRFTDTEIPAIIFTGDSASEEIDTAHLDKCLVLRKPQDTKTLTNNINEMTV